MAISMSYSRSRHRKQNIVKSGLGIAQKRGCVCNKFFLFTWWYKGDGRPVRKGRSLALSKLLPPYSRVLISADLMGLMYKSENQPRTRKKTRQELFLEDSVS